MKYLLLATTLLATPALAQNLCPGQTFSENFQNGTSAWQSTISEGDASVNNPSHASANSSGLTLNAGPSGGSWLENTNFQQTYGVFRATVSTTDGMLATGMTSAVWLLANHIAIGSQQAWPAEIDFWETAGNTADTAMHSGFTSNNAPYYETVAPGQHTVTVDWEPDTITWFIDGQQVQQQPTPPDFNTPMHFILDAMNQGSNASGSMTVQSLQAFDTLQHANACAGTATANPQSPGLSPERCLLAPKGPGCPADVSQQAAYQAALQQAGSPSQVTTPTAQSSPTASDSASSPLTSLSPTDLANIEALLQQIQSELRNQTSPASTPAVTAPNITASNISSPTTNDSPAVTTNTTPPVTSSSSTSSPPKRHHRDRHVANAPRDDHDADDE